MTSIDPAIVSAMPDATTYERLRAMIDRADAWIDSIRGRNGWASYKPEEAPDYVQAVNNGMRAQVELFETYRDKPARFTAYACDHNRITNWTGFVWGHYRELSSWRDGHGNRVRYLECRLPGLGVYRGRNAGDGMYINLRAISKR